MKSLFSFLLIFIITAVVYAQDTAPSATYFESHIIVKVKAEFADKCSKSAINLPQFQSLVSENTISSSKKLFPNHNTLKRNKSNADFVDLSTVYRIKIKENIDPKKLIALLKKEAFVEYAELEYINQIAYAPNDTAQHQQYYLSAIQAYDAWDIQKGDTSVVIGIIDTGSDMDHSDLEDDFAINYADPINGIDDDNDGFIDNYMGWDAANNDNNPEYSTSGHGTNVAGLASASTDNTTGISGPGFNTRLLTVRIDEEGTGQLTAAYEGLVYAADHGAFIINNSWGSYSYSRLAQDVINYAAINQGALVICAVGNGPFGGPNAGTGVEDRFYPAAYENVFSVGALDPGDTVKGSSNYGYWVQIFAPGGKMYTTAINNGYRVNGGTSMAAPVLAGVAALVKSEFPNYTAEQVKQRILNTADDVSGVNEAKYQNKLGAGRVNAYRALIDSTTPGIAFKNKVISDQNDSTFTSGDTLRVWGDFTNYLADAKNVSVSLRSIENEFQVLNATVNLGDINSNTAKSNHSTPFLLVVNTNVPYNDIADIELTITATNYSVKRFFSIPLNPSYLTVNENNLTVTLPSNGRLGYAESNSNLGEGLSYLNENSLLYEGSFIIGNSANYVPNTFRIDDQSSDEDFKIEQSIRAQIPTKAKFEAFTVFNDGNLSNPSKLKIKQHSFFFNTNSTNNSVIHTYEITNTSGSTLSDLYGGLLIDWDISDYSKNKVYYDVVRTMGISYSTDSNLFCGIRALNDSNTNFHYAIDNIQGGNGGINTRDDFTDSEKFMSISSSRDSAGNSTVEGNDIMDVNSIGPFTLLADSSILLSFSITIAESIQKLEEESDSIALLFKQLSLSIDEQKPHLEKVILYPNPTNNLIQLDLITQKSESLSIAIYDVNGKLVQRKTQVFSAGKQQIKLNVASWKTGVYFLNIKGDKINIQNTFVVAP